jgi:hypothetical protein
MSSGEKAVLSLPSTGNVKVGALLLINGEGTSRGLSWRPAAKKPKKTIKIPMGIK